jgi:hypothetical protein
VKAKLTESQLKRIIFEELLEHYLVQKELWSDDQKREKSPDQVNKDGVKVRS